MTMKRASGAVVLVLLACGPGGDTPTPSPAEQDSKATEKDMSALRDRFLWGDEGQPARDWDLDAEACDESAREHPRVRNGAPPLTGVALFIKCMQEKGWVVQGKSE